MVNKKFNNKKIINAEKYIFLLLLLSYITGICIGSFFVFSNNDNAKFTNVLISQKDFKVLLYFIIALLLKYSGVLSGMLSILPLFLGIQNAANYSCCILNISDTKYKTAFTILKDTAIVMLLVFYIIIIINQIINKKYILKKDIKYFTVYFIAATVIIVLGNILKKFIF